jgi:mRNA interferase RelE/StbE
LKYNVEIKPRALKDLRRLDARMRERILDRIEAARENFAGDVKRLTNFTPEYRLRVGQYRVLFELEADTVVVYRVIHRRESYR